MSLEVQSVVKRLLRGCPLLLCIAIAPAHAELAGDVSPRQSPAISLSDLVVLAFENNPALKSAKLRWEAAIERYPQERALPDPVVMYQRSRDPSETMLTLSQAFPFPGKLKLKGDIASRDAQIARLEFEKATRDIIVALKVSYYELLYISRAIEITKQNKAVMDHLVKIGTADYAQDVTTLNDVMKAQAQLAQLSYDLVLLEELRHTEVTRLNTLVSRDPDTPIAQLQDEPIPPLNFSVEDLYSLAREHQEELKIADLEIEKSLKAAQLAERVSLPDFKVGLNYMDMDEAGMSTLPMEERDAFGFSVELSLPIWFNKNRAAKTEARLNYLSTREERDAHLNETYAEIKNIYFKLANADRLVKLYRESLIPQADKSLQIAETWYREGKGSFSDLLETQSLWLNFNLAYYRAISDYQQQLGRLEQLVGTSLQGVAQR